LSPPLKTKDSNDATSPKDLKKPGNWVKIPAGTMGIPILKIYNVSVNSNNIIDNMISRMYKGLMMFYTKLKIKDFFSWHWRWHCWITILAHTFVSP